MLCAEKGSHLRQGGPPFCPCNGNPVVRWAGTITPDPSRRTARTQWVFRTNDLRGPRDARKKTSERSSHGYKSPLEAASHDHYREPDLRYLLWEVIAHRQVLSHPKG